MTAASLLAAGPLRAGPLGGRNDAPRHTTSVQSLPHRPAPALQVRERPADAVTEGGVRTVDERVNALLRERFAQTVEAGLEATARGLLGELGIVRYRETLHGVPVLGGFGSAVVRRDGSLHRLTADLHRPTPSDPPEPLVTREQARTVVRAALDRGEPIAGRSRAELAWRPLPGGDARLVWRVTLPALDPPRDLRGLVDARTGQLLSLADAGMHADGRGTVFRPDPLTVTGASYGDAGFVDSYSPYENDITSSQLNAARDTVVLRDIAWRDGAWRLEGPHVTIRDLASPVYEPPASASGDFFFTRDQRGFEEVMAYFHLDSIQRYVQGLGFASMRADGVVVDAAGMGEDNSMYMPSTRQLYFGIGGVDDAEDADVLAHEYFHALHHAAMGDVEITSEQHDMRSVAEGFADYFAGAWSARFGVYQPDSLKLFNWDGNVLGTLQSEHGDEVQVGWEGRSLATDRDSTDWYSPSQINAEALAPAAWYANGAVLADVLWRARLYILLSGGPAEDLDRILLLSLNDHGPQSDLHDVIEALFAADQDLTALGINAQSWQDPLRQALMEKGFLQFVDAPEEGGGDPGAVKPGAFALLAAWPNPFNGALRMTVTLPERAQLELEVFDLLGRQVGERPLGVFEAGRRELQWRAPQSLASGTYLLRVRSDAGHVAVQRITLVR